ncbi:MAG: asparaginase, partial [Acidimicrobiia bacterium]
MVRAGVVEATHEGAVAAVASGGSLIAGSGDLARRFFYRSATKPIQAMACQELGAGLGGEQLAVACASHEGEPVHVALVAEMLAEAGLSESDLGCPPSW